ncbi:MAG: cation diffusion facilitator family transporter [Anaeromyxobacter sp.]
MKRGDAWKRVALVLPLATAYMVAEAVGGWLTNSLALLADAGHMLSDVAALGLTLFAMWIARRPPTVTRTFGYYRAEILAALANGATLVAVALYVFAEAWARFRDPPAVMGGEMLAVAVGGLLVNLVSLWILRGSHGESLNVRGAWLHVLGDALGSVGAIASGALVWAFDWRWADPVASVAIGILIVHSSWSLIREAVAVLMEGAPGGVEVDAVRDALGGIAGVREVHELHVWSISSGLVSLSCHLVAESGAAGVLDRAREVLRERFEIHHVTIQVEQDSCGGDGHA